MNSAQVTLAKALLMYGNAKLTNSQRILATQKVFEHIQHKNFKAQFSNFHEAMVEDALHEVLANLLERNTFRGEFDGQAHGYLKQAVRNELLKLKQENQRHQRLASQDAVEDENVAGAEQKVIARERLTEAEKTIETFVTQVAPRIATHAYKRSDGQTNFLVNVTHMIALALGNDTKEALVQQERRRRDLPDNDQGLESARDSLDQHLTRARKRINSTLRAVEQLCLALANDQPPPCSPTPFAALAVQLQSENLIPCHQLHEFQRLALALRQRRPTQR